MRCTKEQSSAGTLTPADAAAIASSSVKGRPACGFCPGSDTLQVSDRRWAAGPRGGATVRMARRPAAGHLRAATDRAPSPSEASLAQTIAGSTWSMVAMEAKPQSTPAITRSGPSTDA